MSFSRLRLADWVALLAALALLLVMALDWYTTNAGAEYRRDAGLAIPGSQTRGAGPDLKGAYAQAASELENNAWQETATIDRAILVALLVAAGAAVIAAFARAADHRFKSSFTPSGIAALAGATAALMLAYRILQPPGWNPGAVVKVGAPLGLLCVAVLAMAAHVANRHEHDGTAWSRADAEPQPAAEPDPAAAPPAPGSPAV
jgi:hypothetical protein